MSLSKNYPPKADYAFNATCVPEWEKSRLLAWNFTTKREPRTKNQEPRTKNQEPRTKNQEPRTTTNSPAPMAMGVELGAEGYQAQRTTAKEISLFFVLCCSAEV